jgi:O-antigen/teichoic acid export membrane protein
MFYMIKRFFNIQLIKSFVGVSTQYFLGILLLFVMNIVLARTMSVSDFGIFGFVLSLSTVLSIPVSGGLSMFLTREVAGYTQTRNWSAYRGLLLVACWWVILASFICGLALLSLTVIIERVPVHLYLIAFAFVPIMGLNTIRSGILKGLGHPILADGPTMVLQPMLLIIAYLLLAYLGLTSATNALLFYFVVFFIVFGMASVMLFLVQPSSVYATKSDMSDKPLWFRALLPFMLMNATTLLSTQTAILIAGFMGKDEVVAYIRVAERGAMVSILPFHVLTAIISPQIVTAIRSGDIIQLRDIVRRSSQLIFFTSLPLVIIILLFGEQIINLLFGNKYGENSYLPIVIVSVTQVFFGVFGLTGLLLTMGGKEQKILISQILALGINLLLCILLIGPYGAVGASIGISAGLLVSTTINVLLIKRYFGFIPGIFLRKSFEF